jgi:uncharacterized membrane protein (TIGR02234 family)
MTSGLGQPPRGRLRALWTGSAARELTATLLLGAVGAGLAFLATRQAWAQVRTIPPKPLPASTVTVTGAQLAPYADALILAGLATLAAVLASRGLLRRITGVLLAGIAGGVAAAAFTVTQASAISAASANIGPATASAGSVMDGSSPAASVVPNVSGTVPHVIFAAAGWQTTMLIGAIAMGSAGLLVAWRARRLAVMSSRYDAPAGAATARGHGGASGRGGQSVMAGEPAPASERPVRAPSADSASIWEALSRGEDPTAAGSSQRGT